MTLTSPDKGTRQDWEGASGGQLLEHESGANPPLSCHPARKVSQGNHPGVTLDRNLRRGSVLGQDCGVQHTTASRHVMLEPTVTVGLIFTRTPGPSRVQGEAGNCSASSLSRRPRLQAGGGGSSLTHTGRPPREAEARTECGRM